MILENRREGEDVPGVVVDDQDLSLAQDLIRSMEPFEELLLGLGKIGDDPVQEERRFVKQPLRGLDVLEDDALGGGPQPFFLGLRQVLAREHDDR